MQIDKKIYKAFLEEMHELENFRMAYVSQHPSISLDRDDPDVKRLVEALAFFSARTHMAGVRNIVSSRLRLFQQFFPFLLSPLPAMGMLMALPTGQLSESVFFPGGSELLVSQITGSSSIWRTLRDLRILPINLTRTEMLLMPEKGFRLLICFESRYSRSDEIDQISLNINYLDNYTASLLVFESLRNHHKKVQIVFDEKADEMSRGIPCSLSFDNHYETEDIQVNETGMHPLQKARFFFHFPQQLLYMNINVPQMKQNWKSFTVCIDLDSKWPKNLVINKEIFKLHTTPMENLNRAHAAPFIYDGTMERYLIVHPEPEKGFALQSILGVYKIEKKGMVPLRPGIVAGGEGSYEIEQETITGGVKRTWLNLHYSEAFLEPVTLIVEALWFQPGCSEMISQKLKISPYSRNIPGVKWELGESTALHADNNFEENMAGFMHLLAIKNKSSLNFEEIITLIEILGSVWNGDYRQVKEFFYDVKIEQVSHKEGGTRGMLKLIYYLCFKACEPGLKPLLKNFTYQIGLILDAWISQAVIEARMEIDTV